MKKYECPHCHEETFSLFQKIFAGQMTKQGKPCPKCGKKCVNDANSTYARIIINLILLVFMIFAVVSDTFTFPYRYVVILAGFAVSRVLMMVFDAIFSKLTEAIRT